MSIGSVGNNAFLGVILIVAIFLFFICWAAIGIGGCFMSIGYEKAEIEFPDFIDNDGCGAEFNDKCNDKLETISGVKWATWGFPDKRMRVWYKKGSTSDGELQKVLDDFCVEHWADRHSYNDPPKKPYH